MYYDIKQTGARIRSLRKAHGFTQEEMATHLNVTSKHIRNIERGEYGASVDLMIKMSELFCISLDYLVLGREHPNSKIHVQIQRAITLLSEIEGML